MTRYTCSVKKALGVTLTLKWLADQFSQVGNTEYKSYAEIKPRLRFGTTEQGLIIKVRPLPPLAELSDYKPLNLDAAALARLTAMSQDQKYSPAERERFAAVLRREREFNSQFENICLSK